MRSSRSIVNGLGGRPVPLRLIFPFIERVFADGGYAGERVATATRIIVDIVNKHQSGRLHCLATPMGRRALLRLDRTQSQTRKGLRGHDRLCQSIPVRRIHHAALTPYREGSVSFETDSKASKESTH
jgi:hypothetical protein